jgi:predicted nucleic acid-binding protein
VNAELAVIDTNVWVSAFLAPASTPAKLLDAMQTGLLVPVFSAPVESEYHSVLTRAKFNIDPETLSEFFRDLRVLGLFHNNPPPLGLALPDPTDAPFIELALYAQCPVITGNAKHFPPEPGCVVLTPTEWVAGASTGG